MSSPAVFSEGHSPISGDPFMDEDGSSEIQKRMMRVKVLYTFDDQNKTNCLARLPNALPIPVVAVDDENQIGVIELRTCIQAVISSSPELMSKLEQDYTVYAYDYSEYETPLVGQGMLSRVLASASPTPRAPANQSGTMITGRVCKNILGIFSNGVKETLEVKIKLVPVPIKLQSEYDKAMNSYRHTSRTMSDSFSMDGSRENSFNADFGQFINSQAFGGQGTNRPEMRGYDMLHDMLTPNFTGNGEFDDIMSQGSGRPGSATPSMAPQNMGAQGFDISRPDSRASTRIPHIDSWTEEQSIEEGPARKRARLMQTDWQGRPNIGGRANSLRVAASTTASIREFRPSIENASINNDLMPRAPTPRPSEKRRNPSVSQPSGLRRISYTENNSPAPMSDITIFDEGQSQASSPANIPSSPPVFLQDKFALPSSPLPMDFAFNADSGFQSDLPTEFPQPHSDLPQQSQNRASSEKRAVAMAKWRNTRVKKNANAQWAMSQPSDYGADFLDAIDLFGVDTTHKLPKGLAPPPPPKKPRKSRAKKKKVTTPNGTPIPELVTSEAQTSVVGQALESSNDVRVASEQSRQPVADVANTRQSSNDAANLSNGNSNQAQESLTKKTPALQPLPQSTSAPSREGSLGPAAEPVILPKRNPLSKRGIRPRSKTNFPRATTWSHPSSDVDGLAFNSDMADIPQQAATPEPHGFDVENTAKPRSGSGAVRMRSITTLLERQIAAGETIKYCMNCGAIKPPTWRPYWIRVEYGTGENVQCGSETGIHCIEPVSRDENGKVLTYRVYKQWAQLTTEERDSQMFEQLMLCNSCGDYFKKHKAHRPEKYWPGTDASLKLAQVKSTKNKKDEVDVSQESSGPDASITPEANPSGSVKLNADGEVNDTSNKGMAPPPAPNSNAPNQWNDESALMALQRAIQQSPARIIGSKDSPIEVQDKTPDSVRRVLFPSPRKAGEFRSLEDGLSETSQQHKHAEFEAASPTPVSNTKHPRPASFEVTDQSKIASQDQIVNSVEFDLPDKENRPPEIEADDNLASLFDFDGQAEQSPRISRSLSQLLKTPTKVRTPRREPLSAIMNKAEHNHPLLLTPTRQVAASSPLPTNHVSTGLTPFGMNQLFYTDSFSPSKLEMSPNWLKNLPTPKASKTDGEFTFDQDFFSSLSSDMPMSSSPGLGNNSYNFFEFWEDNTATAPVHDATEKSEKQNGEMLGEKDQTVIDVRTIVQNDTESSATEVEN